MTCSVDGCDKPIRCRKLCGAHYQRFKKDGTIEVKRQGPNTGLAFNGIYWRAHRPGHPLAGNDGYVLLHRLVAWACGMFPEGVDPSTVHVHHINHNKLDNRPANLEALPAVEHKRRHLEEEGTVANKHGTWPLLAGCVCSVDGCDLDAARKGMCDAHATRFDRYGDPLAVKRVGKFTRAPYRLIQEAS